MVCSLSYSHLGVLDYVVGGKEVILVLFLCIHYL